jgi:molybdopterin-guanine dinucleotide biosynthesis protein B
MNVIGFIGSSNAGKTTLIEKLVVFFVARGLRIAVVKHAHDGFDIDRPGKDSFRFRDAGARQVLVAARSRWALLTESVDLRPTLAELLARLDPCDLVLVEGFRAEGDFARIEVRRTGVAERRVEPGANLVAIASDTPVDGPLPFLPLDDVAMIAGFVARRFHLIAGAEPGGD